MDTLLKVNTGRMRQLADFLETVPPEDFDLSLWQSRASRDAIKLGPITLIRRCGFAGCAMGWAAHSKLFDGLKINRDRDLTYMGARGADAAAKVFGITSHTAEFLFWESSYEDYDPIDPADVAARLRCFASKVEARIAKRSGKAWVKKLATAEA